MNINKQRGMHAEKFACQYLKKQGLKLLERNFYCRCGEVDLIMKDGEFVVFVEVRLRNTQQYSGAESVDYFKQQKLIKTAQFYLQKHNNVYTQACRFDVTSLYQQDKTYHVDWIKDAFTC